MSINYPMVINQIEEETPNENKGIFASISEKLGITSLVSKFNETMQEFKQEAEFFEELRQDNIARAVGYALEDKNTREEQEEYLKTFIDVTKGSAFHMFGDIKYKDLIKGLDKATEEKPQPLLLEKLEF